MLPVETMSSSENTLFDQSLIDPEIARAWTLPARFYVDPETYQDELRQIFHRTWQVAGHRDQLAQPGDYFTAEVAGEPLLLVREHNREARGFYNVCRHRAGPPAQGCGSRKIFRCGYHGWTYGLDGKLITAPEFEAVEAFEPEHFSLRTVHVAECSNLVFVNLDDNAEPLASTLYDLSEQAGRYPFTEMKLFERRTYEMKCNWKTYVDNYLEGYHLPSVHPGLNRELDYSSYEVETHDAYVRQFSPIRCAQPGDASPRRYPSAPENLITDYFWIFPNWMLNCYPDNVSLNVVLPMGPERSVVIFEWYLPEHLLGTETARRAVAFSDDIQAEDAAICETVQKNLASRSYDRGRYSVKQEKGVHAFHRLYATAMGGGGHQKIVI
jgi:choline monooxygenase